MIHYRSAFLEANPGFFNLTLISLLVLERAGKIFQNTLMS